VRKDIPREDHRQGKKIIGDVPHLAQSGDRAVQIAGVPQGDGGDEEVLSPLGWEHINLTGDYVWSAAGEMTENGDGFRPLRPAPDPALMVA